MEAAGYIAEPAIATAVFLAGEMRKPLLIEGDAGVGKTEVAKVLARLLDTELIRLQCYEGLDVQTALYEWDYPRQMLRVRMAEHEAARPAEIEARDLQPRLPPRAAAAARDHARAGPPVLLIDEIDRADDGFEAFLLEVLSDFQVTIPELGTIARRASAARRPDVEPHAARSATRCGAAASTSTSSTRASRRRCASSARACPARASASRSRSAASSRPCAGAVAASRPRAWPRRWTGRGRWCASSASGLDAETSRRRSAAS